MTIKKPLVIEQPKLGQIIHELRTVTGLTQEQFTTHLGVNYSTVNRWENKRSKLSPMANHTDFKSTQQEWQYVHKFK